MANNFKNILIIKPSSLGDIVMALPALSALRRNFPQSRISWLIRPEFAPLLRGHPQLDEIILFDRRSLGKAWCNWEAFTCLMELIWQLRREKFDAVTEILNPVLDVRYPDASFYLWQKTPIADTEFAQGLFAQQNITVLPGCYLSRKANGTNPGEQFVRIALVARVEECIEAAQRIRHYVESL